jgi:tRNA threonylcarbamoyladenosine biosynthesis protein TsaB
MLLAVDTSTQTMGIAVRSEHRILSEMMGKTHNFHTVELASAVNRILDRQELSPQDLKVLGVAVGPGSFTGLRIGLAFIKGISYARQIPIVGIPTLDITAAGVPIGPGRELVAVLGAGRGRLAAGWYRSTREGWVSSGELQNLTPDQLLNKLSGPTLLSGEIPDELFPRIEDRQELEVAPPAQAVRRPAVLADLAWKRWTAGMADDPTSLSPIYLQRGS